MVSSGIITRASESTISNYRNNGLRYQRHKVIFPELSSIYCCIAFCCLGNPLILTVARYLANPRPDLVDKQLNIAQARATSSQIQLYLYYVLFHDARSAAFHGGSDKPVIGT